MKMVARTPISRAARATPCAWLPAEAATTPRARSSSVRCDIRVYAPRTLKEPVRWRFSHLRSTWLPVSAESQRDSSIGVRTATPWISSAARSMSSTETRSTSAIVLPITPRGPALRAVSVELVGHPGVLGVADGAVVGVAGLDVGVDVLPGVLVVGLERDFGILSHRGLARQMLYDGVGGRRERYGDQRPGDPGEQDAGGDRDDHAQRVDRDEPTHQERLEHVALDLLHEHHGAQHQQGHDDAVVDE